MEKHYQISKKTVWRIYFRFYLLVMVLHLIHERKSVCEEILQQKLQAMLHIIIYKKLRQLLIFVGRMLIE
jgi:hypothetical protein